MTLSPLNGLFVSQTLAKLHHVDSAVPLDLQPFCSELFTRCRSDAAAMASSRYLLEALEADFVDELQNCNAVSSLAPAPPRLAKARFSRSCRAGWVSSWTSAIFSSSIRRPGT